MFKTLCVDLELIDHLDHIRSNDRRLERNAGHINCIINPEILVVAVLNKYAFLRHYVTRKRMIITIIIITKH